MISLSSFHLTLYWSWTHMSTFSSVPPEWLTLSFTGILSTSFTTVCQNTVHILAKTQAEESLHGVAQIFSAGAQQRR